MESSPAPSPRPAALALFDAAPSALVALDGAGAIIEANRAARDLLGLAELPCDWPEAAAFAPEDRAARAAGALNGAGARGGGLSRARYRLAGARERLFEATLSPCPHLGEGVCLLALDLVTGSDPDRMAELETAARVASGVAHDVNNLLSVVIGALELAAPRAGEDARAKRGLDTALGAARMGGELIARLLGPARNGTAPVCARDLLEELERLGAAALGPTLRFEVARPNAALRLRGDRARVLTALLNLVVNARDAILVSGKGGAIRVACHLTPGREDRAEIVVEDDGPGMTAEVFARALDPFFSTKSGARRSGLGLTMAHEAARRCGGDLVIETAPGRGARVRMILPLVAAEADQR